MEQEGQGLDPDQQQQTALTKLQQFDKSEVELTMEEARKLFMDGGML